MSEPIEFHFGETVKIEFQTDRVQVRGKIKNMDCYVVVINEPNVWIHATFGTPNRHLELDWGAWSGNIGEFVASSTSLERIK